MDLTKENFTENINPRIKELKERFEYFKLNSKYLEFNEIKIKEKRSELEEMQMRLDEEERENFNRYQVKIK